MKKNRIHFYWIALLTFIFNTGFNISYSQTTDDYIKYKKAADQGDAEAQFNLGVMYSLGEGVPKDYKQAVYWYRKAADQGHADAQSNLGFMYHEGRGVPKDDTQAVYWLRKAADQGHADV